MKIDLLPKQWEVFNPSKDVDYDIALYQGGVGSGKTFLGALTGIMTCHANPGCTWLVGADTMSRLSITTAETYEEILQDHGIRYRYNKSEHIIRIPAFHDARILFKGLDDPQSLRSVNGIGGHLEEASLITEAAYLEFLGRLRQAKPGMPIRVILTTNPQTMKGWLFDHFVTQSGITTERIRGNDIKINRRRVVARTLDNPYVSDAFIATLKASYDEQLWRIMVLGEDGDYTAGLVCKTWGAPNIEDTPYRPDQRIYLTCDFNVDPMCWALAHRYNHEFHFFDELCLPNSTTVDAADEFARRYEGHTAGITVTGDASGRNRGTVAQSILDTNFTLLRNRLSQLNFSDVRLDVASRNPDVQERTMVWNAACCSADGIVKIKVNPKCEWLITNCENLHYIEGTSVIWEPTQRNIDNDPKLKYTKHVWDAASYLVYRYDPIKREGPLQNKSLQVRAKAFQPRRAF